jgi:hypothetical protein
MSEHEVIHDVGSIPSTMNLGAQHFARTWRVGVL